MKGVTRHLAALALWLVAGQALAGDASIREDDVARDLRTALALEGASCDAVSAYSADGPMDYSVECRNGHRYHLSQDDAGALLIESPLLSPLRIVRRVLDHVPLLRHAGRALLSVVGFDCAEVATIESDDAHGQLIGCANGARFHVRVAPDGRVDVLQEE